MRLTYIVPIDIHPRRGEISKTAQIPQKAKSSDIEIISLLSVLRFTGIRSFIKKPKIPPRIKTPILEARGSRILPISILPAVAADETDIAILYAKSATISSRATTCRSVSTKSPFAPVCRMVMTVDAGAVAEASAASTREKEKLSLNIEYDTRKTSTEARQASNNVITITLIPFFFSVSKRKNSPVPKAIKANAISERKSIPEITFSGTNPKQYGPKRIPVIIYAVTFGSRSFLVSLVTANPQNSMSATEIMSDAEEETLPNVF